MKTLTVIKRNTHKEPFQPEKIKRVVKAAGLNEKQADQLIQTVLDWLDKQDRDEIKSVELRDKILEVLKKVDTYAAGLFEWYEKTKDGEKR